MHKWILLLIPFLALPVAARDIYKWTSDDGVVQYSDTYRAGAERVTVRDEKLGTVKPSPSPEPETAEADAVAAGYEAFAIAQPENDETIRSNEGVVTVGLSLSPALASGHVIKVSVDGTELAGDIKTTQFTLNDLNRGTHSLLARVVDDQGNTLISADPINFHLRKASIIKP